MISILSISVGAVAGALCRWGLALAFNAVFPTIPLGTLAANLIGGFLIGAFMAVMRSHAFIPEAARLAIATGFLGSLTTFSTFSAETVHLLSSQEYFWSFVMIIVHVAGSIAATILGIYSMKLLMS